MALIVKAREDAMRMAMLAPQATYEFFTTEVVTDVNDNEVEIPKSIGWFTISQLESEKAMLLSRIAEIDEKLKAIGSL